VSAALSGKTGKSPAHSRGTTAPRPRGHLPEPLRLLPSLAMLRQRSFGLVSAFPYCNTQRSRKTYTANPSGTAVTPYQQTPCRPRGQHSIRNPAPHPRPANHWPTCPRLLGRRATAAEPCARAPNHTGPCDLARERRRSHPAILAGCLSRSAHWRASPASHPPKRLRTPQIKKARQPRRTVSNHQLCSLVRK
jgi:hypothetical protein